MKLAELLQMYAGKFEKSSENEKKESTVVVSKSTIDEQMSLPVAELSADINDWSEYWREAYEERAAIMENNGGMSHEEAEKEAEKLIREEFRREQNRS